MKAETPSGARSPVRGVLRLSFGDEAAAATAAAALQPDNGEHLRLQTTRAAGGTILALEAGSDSPMGLLRTLDDALACLRATGIP